MSSATATKPTLTNVQYKKAYTDLSKIQAARDALAAAKTQAQAEWDRWEAECKEKAGKKAKGLVPSLDDRNVKRTSLYIQYDIEALKVAITAAEKAREKLLDELADRVKPINKGPLVLISTSDPSAYRSQGLGADKYAEGALIPYRDKLISVGITAVVERVPRTYEYGGKTYSNHDYQLKAQCPLWMADAINRTIGLYEGIRSLVKFGCNARVYMPFLDPNIDIYKL